MEKEVQEAIEALCDQVKTWADSRRNISMKSFNNHHTVQRLRKLIGRDIFSE